MLVFSLASVTLGLVLVLMACHQPAGEKIIYPQTKKWMWLMIILEQK